MPDLLATRLNFDAILFMGCTAKELEGIAFLSLVICLLGLGVITQLLFGMFLIGIGLAFPSSVGLSCLFAKCLQRAKWGKPEGYVKQRLLLKAQTLGLQQTIFTNRRGAWSLGRRVS